MPRKPNEIAVDSLESKDVGKRHWVNVKHIIGKLEIAVGEAIVKLNLWHYRAEVVDLHEWTPPLKKRSAESRGKKQVSQKVSKKVSKKVLKKVCCLHG